MITILVKKKQGKLIYFGYVAEQELSMSLCTLSIPEIKTSIIVDSRDIKSIIRTDGIFTLPVLTKERPNVRSKGNHSKDLALTIGEFSGYEMKKYGVKSSYYKV
jgi:hypothetical protein